MHLSVRWEEESTWVGENLFTKTNQRLGWVIGKDTGGYIRLWRACLFEMHADRAVAYRDFKTKDDAKQWLETIFGIEKGGANV